MSRICPNLNRGHGCSRTHLLPFGHQTMKKLEEEIASLLVDLMTDGFNRSVGALRDAGAINTKRMAKEYSGIGSRYYDMVTEQMELTVSYAKPTIQKMVEDYEARRGQERSK